MWREVAGVALGWAFFVLAVLGLLHLFGGWRPWRRPLARIAAWWQHRRPESPAARPVEDLAVLARRLGRRFHHPPEGQRFVKCEAVRRAYDTVLVEASQALGVTTLLTVIAPGPELDAERGRVELALEERGFELGLPL
jgi:hypothetical protein